MVSKNFSGYLILDYKKGSFCVLKRLGKKFRPYHIPLKISIDVHLPEPKEYALKGDITIPETKVADMVLEEI